MDNKYIVKISMTSDDNHKINPYFWCVLKLKGETWINNGFGWSNSPQEAWDQAYTYYNKHYINP